MRVLITGVSGFVGPYIVRSLSQGNDIFGLDRTAAAIRGCKKIVACDITDNAAVAKAVAGIKPDAIIHLAGQSSVEKSWDAPEETFRINVEGTENLLACVVDAGLMPKILVVSSAEVYGKQESFPIPEEAALSPGSPYAESRAEQEQVALRHHERYGIPVVISRSFHHTGPGQQPSFVCPAFAQQVAEIEAKKRDGMLVGNLEAVRDISDVRDVAKAYRVLLEKGSAGETYNVCSGVGHSIREVLDMMLSFSPAAASAKVVRDSARIRRNDVPKMIGDNSRLQSLGWSVSVPLEQTLRDILDYFRQKRHKTKKRR